MAFQDPHTPIMNHFQPPDVILIHSSPEPEFIDLTILDDADDADDLDIQFLPGLPPPRPTGLVPQTTSILTLPTPPPSLNIPTHTKTPPVPQCQSLLPVRENSESTELFTRSSSQTASRATTVSSQAPVIPLKKKRGRPPRKAVEIKDAKDPREHAVLRTLEPYLLAARAENTQIVKNALKAGRLTAKKELLRRQGDPGGIIMDDEDPFEGMKSVECFHSVAKTVLMVFNPEINAGDGKKLCLASKRIVMPTNLPEVPSYRAMTTLRTNIMTPDDPVLHYVPYYGESSEEQEEEKDDYATLFSRNGVRIAEKDEVGRVFSKFVPEFLSECGVSVDTVAKYLLGDVRLLSKYYSGGSKATEKPRQKYLPEEHDSDYQTARELLKGTSVVNMDQIKICELVCKVFKDTTKQSIWYSIKHTKSFLKDTLGWPTRITPISEEQSDAQKKASQNSLLGMADLMCSVCYMLHCPFHREQNDNMVIGNCRRRLTRKNKITNKENAEERLQMELPHWPAAAPGSTENPWPFGKPCSDRCSLYSTSEGIPIPEWPENIKNRLLEAASVLIRNARISCICAIIVNKPCREVRLWLEKVPESIQLISENPDIPDNVLQRIPSKPLGAGKRRHRWHEDYPASCFRPPKPSKDNENTDWPQFVPCIHLGPCTTKTCRCLRDYHTCEKTCCCPPSCPRRWRGCVCRKNNKPCSRQSECACLDAGRECDPDLCGSCGAIEVLDPRNRGTPLTDENCQNVNLQLGRQRRTFIGISYVGGIGLYAAEKIPKNSFLGEYTGEVISDEEGVRRHKDAEKRKLSYLFGLNRSQSADAVRAGNKLRFTNHSAQNANVGVRTTFVNGVHRITFCAEKLIYPGDELWFDYAYPPVWIKKFNLREPVLPPRQGTVGRGKRKAQDSDEETEFEDEDISEELVAQSQSETRSSRALSRIAVKTPSERMAMKSGNRNNGKRIGGISGSASERENESRRSKSQRLRLVLR